MTPTEAAARTQTIGGASQGDGRISGVIRESCASGQRPSQSVQGRLKAEVGRAVAYRQPEDLPGFHGPFRDFLGTLRLR